MERLKLWKDKTLWKIRKTIIDFLWIAIVRKDDKYVKYERILSSKTMDIIEKIIKFLQASKLFFLTIWIKISFTCMMIFFTIVPVWSQLSAREIAEKWTAGFTKRRNSEQEMYQARWEVFKSHAINAAELNTEVIAMTDEERKAHWSREFQTLSAIRDDQKKMEDEWFWRYYIPYEWFTINLYRDGYHFTYDNWATIPHYQLDHMEVDNTDKKNRIYSVYLKKWDSTVDELIDTVTNLLIKKHRPMVAVVDELLALPIPKLAYCLNEFVHYKGIDWVRPERTEEQMQQEYSQLFTMLGMQDTLEENIAQQDNKDIAMYQEDFANALKWVKKKPSKKKRKAKIKKKK